MTVTGVHPNLDTWRLQFHQLLAKLDAAGIQATPESARQALADLTARYVTPGPELARVEDLALSLPDRSISLRFYQAKREQVDKEAEGQAKPTDLVLFVHGGGHMAGSIDVYDPICRRLAQASKQAVLSIEYRLAPEHPWPCGIDDVRAVMAHLPELLDRLQLPLAELNVHMMGDSGGGAMVATICLQPDNDLGFELQKLVLVYPSLDYRMETDSVRLFGDEYMLTADRMRWYFDNYLQEQADPLSISPLEMSLPGAFPETLIINAGFDPLKDEAELFKVKLVEAGFSAQLACYDDMLHAFLNLESMVPEVCERAYCQIADFLNA